MSGNAERIRIINSEYLDEQGKAFVLYVSRMMPYVHDMRIRVWASMFKLYWMGDRSLRELMKSIEIQDVKEFKRRFGDFLNIDDLRE